MTTTIKISALLAILATGCGGDGFSSSGLTAEDHDSGPAASAGGQGGEGSDPGAGGKVDSKPGAGGSGSAGSVGTGGSDEQPDSGTGSGGDQGAGGQGSGGSKPGSGGSPAAGGAPSAGGAGSGGSHSSGGSPATGGVPGNGGSSTGGAGSGGAQSAGGSAGAGGSTCVPQPCANDGVTCGQIDDGCGHKVQCIHQCSGNEVCGAATPNRCSVPVCKEFTSSELSSLCAGKCGMVVGKCSDMSSPTVFNCSDHGGDARTGAYLKCDAPKPSGPSDFVPGKSFVGVLEGVVQSFTQSCELGGDHPFSYLASDPLFVDSVMDGSETDVDCGGPYHPARCAVGKSCSAGSDCASFACVAGKCSLSAARPKGCQWPAGTTASDYNGYWCCTDDDARCYRDPASDSECPVGSWNFQCGAAPSSASCKPNASSTGYCCSQQF